MEYQKNTRISRLKAKCAAAAKRQKNRLGTDRGSPGRKRPRSKECNPDQLSPAHVDQELSEEGEEEEGNDAVNTTIDSSVGQLDMDRTYEGIKMYICPYQRQVKKKTNETWETELCGYVLREVGEGKHCLYHCDLCDTDWERKIVDKDGNHFVIDPIRNIAEEALHKYGKLADPRQERVPGILRYVTDGSRFQQMDIPRSHIIFLFHADGAEFSKSTKKKLYLIFVQILNLPLRVRRCV
ncbi:hypothetical protein RvY_08457 [Ramazzottius varieornatus]|uniref:Uncharacterized protein n=1 Tax=Ramazzottius varieornatus TaxID=947166 RepID=A0A1D1V603_RAMVA|nr:hypothetical protein RvY_08457 [Ramazzottius varieornatus]